MFFCSFIYVKHEQRYKCVTVSLATGLQNNFVNHGNFMSLNEICIRRQFFQMTFQVTASAILKDGSLFITWECSLQGSYTIVKAAETVSARGEGRMKMLQNSHLFVTSRTVKTTTENKRRGFFHPVEHYQYQSIDKLKSAGNNRQNTDTLFEICSQYKQQKIQTTTGITPHISSDTHRCSNRFLIDEKTRTLP